jgi:cytochrome c2
MKRNRWAYLLLMLALVFSLGLAACGGDDDDNGDADTDVEEQVGEVATEAADALDEAGDELEGAATEVAGALDEATSGEGDAENGEQLVADNCTGCHAIDSDETVVGPSLQNVANVAGDRVEGLSAEEYLHQSLVEPDAHKPEGFEDANMPSYAEWPESDLNDVVAYLMTLDGGDA